jgi:hypothetical protein
LQDNIHINVTEVVMFLVVFWVVTSGSVVEIIDVAEESTVSIIRKDKGEIECENGTVTTVLVKNAAAFTCALSARASQSYIPCKLLQVFGTTLPACQV